MRMHSISRRDRFYNEMDFYSLPLVHRQPVAPGDSFSFSGSLKIQSAPLDQNVISGAMMSIFYFYVPNRLLWDEWTDFIAQDNDFAGTFPTTSTAWTAVMDRVLSGGFAGFSSLPRRAYKRIYNQFFGDEMRAAQLAWYDDPDDDTVVANKRIKNTEQFVGRLVSDADIASPTFDATTVPIDLNDFYRQMMNARSQRKANMSGDKYVDALRRMGVEPDWRIQNAPEFLFRADRDLSPVKTFSTYDDGTNDTVGKPLSRYEGTLAYKSKKFRFAEHGYVIGVACVRPHAWSNEQGMPLDSAMQTIEDFYLADNLRTQDVYDENFWTSGTGEDLYAQRFAVYRNGVHIRGIGNGWIPNWSPTDGEQMIYPQAALIGVQAESGIQTEVAFLNSCHTVGATGVPANAL